MNKFWRKFWGVLNLKNSWPAFLWLVILIFVIIILFFIPRWFDFFVVDHAGHEPVEYETFYYCLSLAFTGLLIAATLLQLSGVKNTIKSAKRNMRAEFLLNIDTRWGNAESLKAREIIHQFYLAGEEKFGRTTSDNRTMIMDFVAHQIFELRFSKNNDDPSKFMYLLNYLDLMESIGYLYSKKYVTKIDLYELCGHSLKFNYEIYRLYIKDKRNRHGKHDFYEFFAKLYDDINE